MGSATQHVGLLRTSALGAMGLLRCKRCPAEDSKAVSSKGACTGVESASIAGVLTLREKDSFGVLHSLELIDSKDKQAYLDSR